MFTCQLINRPKATALYQQIRTYLKKPFSYHPLYRGHFDYHDSQKYPRKFPPTKEEELLDEVHAIKNMQIDQPSPFHVVRRIKPWGSLPWNQKVTLRRLNLHSMQTSETVIIPNTPQYNDLLLKVKHLIEVKPASFDNGRMLTEEDIGAIKLMPGNGRIKIDEKLRMLESRVNIEKPVLFRGSMLRGKLLKLYGFTTNHHMK